MLDYGCATCHLGRNARVNRLNLMKMTFVPDTEKDVRLINNNTSSQHTILIHSASKTFHTTSPTTISTEKLVQDFLEVGAATRMLANGSHGHRKDYSLAGRRRHEVGLVVLNFLNLTSEIHIHRTSPLGLLDQLPPNEQDWEKSNHEVTEDESGDIPLARQEHSVASDESHDGATNEAIPCKVRLAPSLERKVVAVESLRIASALPENEGYAHDRVVDELRRSHQVDEPFEHRGSVCTDLQEGKESNAQNDKGAVDRYTSTRGTCKNLGCFTFEGEAIEGARCAIDVTVAS